ncbi:MAG: PqqD family protein [Bacteroides sp.]|nr:PqqD family protein [Bacteroides sp.]MDE7449541.1 PqqD family protein [Paramuribaculum sp.]
MKIKKGFALRTIMGQNVIIAEGNNADNYNKIITLNDSAALLWQTFKDKTFDIDDIANHFISTYDLDPAQAQADAAEILTLMTEKGLIDA